jgi:hypothetical protein
MIVTNTKAMAHAFHFFLHYPGDPLVQFTLCETLEQYILPTLRLAEQHQTYFPELRSHYIVEAAGLFTLSAQRQQGDPLILVFICLDKLTRLQ